MELKDFKSTFKIDVYWGDLDAYRHVNNAVYIKWSEHARIDFFSKNGFANVSIDKGAFYPILAYQDIKYFKPVFFPDKIIIGTVVENIKEDEFYLQCHFFSEIQKKKVAISNHKIVILSTKTHKRYSVPKEYISSLKEFKTKELSN